MVDARNAPAGRYRCDVRVLELDGVVELVPLHVRLHRAGRPTPATPEAIIGTPQLNAVGGFDVPVSVTPGTGEVLWALDEGYGATWSAPVPPGVISLPPLAEGAYELRLAKIPPESCANKEEAATHRGCLQGYYGAGVGA